MHPQKQLTTHHIIGIAILVLILLAGAYAAGMITMWNARPAIEQGLTQWAPGSAEANDAAGETETQAPAQAKELPLDREKLLDDIELLLENDYVDPQDIDGTKMLYGAARGMVASLGDPNTAFVDPIPAAIIDEDMTGYFEGIGATVDMIEGQLILAEIIPNSPAVEAGLLARDIVLEVDDVSLAGKTTLEAVSLIRGPKGTVVRLLIQRQSVAEPFVVPVTRDRVELVTVETRMIEGDIAYLRLTEFNAVAQKQVQRGLKELLANEPEGLILDLRQNPGGYLQAAVDIASEFLPRGTLLLSEVSRDGEPREYTVRRAGVALDIPLVILVDGGSASSSEIVAGAIQDHGRGILLGTETFGKGSVQITHTLQDGSSLRITVAHWLLPNGRTLDGEGIIPDQVVEFTAADRESGNDPQIDGAVEYLRQQTARS